MIPPRLIKIVPNWVLAVGVVVALIALYYSGAVPGFNNLIDDNLGTGEDTPELSIYIEIEKYTPEGNYETTASAEIDTEDGALPFTDTDQPFTIIEVGTPFVDPTSIYKLKFTVQLVATPESPAVTLMHGEVMVNGTSGFGEQYLCSAGVSVAELAASTQRFAPGETVTFTGSDATGSSFRYVLDTSADPPTTGYIYGSDIHNSMFTIGANVYKCDSDGNIDPSIAGYTTLTCILKVGEGGDIDVSITNISADSIEG